MGRQVSTDAGLLRRLARTLPQAVQDVATRLVARGARAVLVGGAVRDAYLGRPVLDWDLATDALPEQVAGLFSHISRRGERHGTIMVLTDAGPVEVTTFRGEGVYVDGRRPTSVYFHGDLEADLARRDFTINAVAVELDLRRIADPFGGRQDLRRRLVRCVGDPRERFSEDGLRPLRAVRFASVLNFRVGRATAAALAQALPVLAQVAAERRRDEMLKMLSDARHLSFGLRLLLHSGMLEVVAPELVSAGVRAGPVLERLRPGQPLLRLAAWASVSGLDGATAASLCERWRLARVDARRIVSWVVALADLPAHMPPRAAALRAWLSTHGRDAGLAAATLAGASRSGYEMFATRVRRALARRPPLDVADLALRGDDLLALGLAGRDVGEMLRRLLCIVVADPSLNQADRLRELVHRLSTDAPFSPRSP